MPVVQATLSFVVELGEFHNVDLYHRGFYQIRAYFKVNGQSGTTIATTQSPSKSGAVVEPPILWKRSNTRVHVPEAVHPSFVEPCQVNPVYTPEKMCSKTLRIMYREESARLHDVFEQRILFQVDPTKLEESILKHDLFLCIELWFAEEASDSAFSLHSLEKVYERQLRVQLMPTRGLHYHFDVFFDYFHLCAVEMALHGALTNISPSIISCPKLSPRSTPLPRSSSTQNLAQQSWHSILFTIKNHTSRVQLARNIHRHLCHALLAARESMLMFWREALPYLPVHHRPRIVHLAHQQYGTIRPSNLTMCPIQKVRTHSHYKTMNSHTCTTNFAAKLEELTKTLHALSTDEEMANQLSLDVARLSSQNTALLKQLCKSTVLQYKLTAYMRRKTHQVRMKRFAESFFCQELSIVHLLEIYDPNTVGHEAVASEVRQSPYFQQLPALPISCRELDGDTNSLPIIFEDVFLSPNADESKGVPWRLSSLYDLPNKTVSTPRVPPVGDAPAHLPVHGNSLRSTLNLHDRNSIPVDKQTSAHVSTEAYPSIDPSKRMNFRLRQDFPPLTMHARAFSRSSPALADLGLPRAVATLPPVLRYLGQNRRRFRRSSSHHRQSLQSTRSKHHLISLPDPIHDGPVRLLGYRSVDIMADDPPDTVSKSRPDSVVPRNPRVTDQPIVRLRQRRVSLRARDLRCRSMNSIRTSSSPSSIPVGDQSETSRFCDLQSCCLDSLRPTRLANLQRASSAEQLESVVSDRISFIQDKSLPHKSDATLTSSRAATLQPPSIDTNGLLHPMHRSCSLSATPTHSIALGTLSRAPSEPPGGCVPPAHLTNGLELFGSRTRTNATNTESSMHAFLRSRTLSTLSVPNLAYACALVRVKSESALASSSSGYANNRSKVSTVHRRTRRKLSGVVSKRSQSAMCRVYTSDLACLGSYSELDLTVLEDTASQHCVSQSWNSAQMAMDDKSISHRLARSSSNLCPSEISEPYSHISFNDHIPTDRGEDFSSCATRNRNNPMPYWSPVKSDKPLNRRNGISSTSSEEVTDFILPRQTCGSNKRQSLPVAPSQSITDGFIKLFDEDSTMCRSPPTSVNVPQNTQTLASANRSRSTTGDTKKDRSSMSSEVHFSQLDSRLRECGYQLHSDVDEETDEESVGSRKINGRQSVNQKDEKLSILELLREDGKMRDRHAHSQYSLSTLNGVTKTNAIKRRTLDAGSRSHGTLTSHRSCSTLPVEPDLKPLVDLISPGVVEFLQLKDSIKRRIAVDFQGHIYSDFATVAAPYAYFSDPPMQNDQLHLVVCVHGLDGNASDLRLVRIYLQLALPDCRLEFLMSECNQHDTFAGFDAMRDNLVAEVINYIEELDEPPARISFIAHSMGCVLVRAALLSPLLEPYLPKLHTFLSLSGPHLGTVYNSSGLVNMGMWVMQKWKKSESLSQLRLRDDADLRNTYMYRLSSSAGLDLFRYVLLVSSPQDRYVPYHSTRIELCKAAVRDSSTLGVVYMEMVTNILQRLIKSPRTTVVRYDIHYSLGSSANNLIGRAAHIAVLDSEIFLEKFICVSCAKYFR